MYNQNVELLPEGSMGFRRYNRVNVATPMMFDSQRRVVYGSQLQ